jgi:hypothetical protein
MGWRRRSEAIVSLGIPSWLAMSATGKKIHIDHRNWWRIPLLKLLKTFCPHTLSSDVFLVLASAASQPNGQTVRLACRDPCLIQCSFA